MNSGSKRTPTCDRIFDMLSSSPHTAQEIALKLYSRCTESEINNVRVYIHTLRHKHNASIVCKKRYYILKETENEKSTGETETEGTVPNPDIRKGGEPGSLAELERAVFGEREGGSARIHGVGSRPIVHDDAGQEGSKNHKAVAVP